jgi:tetratricopeptide (TPR) repeat protein
VYVGAAWHKTARSGLDVPVASLCDCLNKLLGFVLNQIPEALGYVRQALQLQGDDANSLHLLALLLSAQKHYHDALNIIDMALSEYPENFM